MLPPLLGIIEFFDVAFLRLVFNLIVDYLITTGYLLPEQREQWVQGSAHIIGLVAAVTFMAIWQHKGHKKTVASTESTTVITDNQPPIVTETKEIKVRDLI